MIALRRSQQEYFERNDKRWNVYNKRYQKIDPHFVYYGTSIKKDFHAQLDHLEKKVHQKTKWLAENIDKLESFTYETSSWNFFLIGFFLDLLPIVLYVWFIVAYYRQPPAGYKSVNV